MMAIRWLVCAWEVGLVPQVKDGWIVVTIAATNGWTGKFRQVLAHRSEWVCVYNDPCLLASNFSQVQNVLNWMMRNNRSSEAQRTSSFISSDWRHWWLGNTISFLAHNHWQGTYITSTVMTSILGTHYLQMGYKLKGYNPRTLLHEYDDQRSWMYRPP